MLVHRTFSRIGSDSFLRKGISTDMLNWQSFVRLYLTCNSIQCFITHDNVLPIKVPSEPLMGQCGAHSALQQRLDRIESVCANLHQGMTAHVAQETLLTIFVMLGGDMHQQIMLGFETLMQPIHGVSIFSG